MINFEYPPLGGGAGRATHALSKELAAMGHEVTVLTTRYQGQPEREVIDGHLVLRIPAPRRRESTTNPSEMLGFMCSALFRAKKLLRPLRPQVSIAFFGIPCGPVGWWLKKTLGIPYIIMLRGGDIPGFLPEELSFYHYLTKPMLHFLWRNAGLVAANSRGARHLAMQTGWGVPIEVIPNGIDANFFSPSTHKEVDDLVSIVFVGRLNPQKSLDNVLTALSKVSLPTQPWRLLIVGDGPIKHHLRQQALELGLEKKVNFLGWQNRDVVRDIYQQSDIFILNSLDEGMPNSLLEAMASGLPSIVTRVAGSEELVNDTCEGLVVESGDIEALAGSLDRLLADTALRQQMGKQARRAAKIRAWRTVAIKFEAMLDRVIYANR